MGEECIVAKIWVLYHVIEGGLLDDDGKLVGCYSSEALALDAHERLKGLPGFADHPDGWVIDEETLDDAHWVEGFK